jgi:hypothetical protein
MFPLERDWVKGIQKHLLKIELSFQHWKKTFRLYGIRCSLRQLLESISVPPNLNFCVDQVSTEDFLKRFGVTHYQFKKLKKEFISIFNKVSQTSNHPSGIKFDSGLILFSIIRINGLTKLYESGFQTGKSSQLMIAATSESSSASVISSDIRAREIPASLRDSNRFKLEIIESKIERFWRNLNRSLRPELWFLDSDNRFHFQLAELRAAAVNCSLIVVNNSHVSEACNVFAEESPFERFDFLDVNRVLTVFTRK